MNPILFCLSIVPLTSPTSHTPTPVLEIAQQHIIRELKRASPQLTVNFDLASCPNVIHFEEGISMMRLVGRAANWSGEHEVSYTDALAGRPIDFRPNLIPSVAVLPRINDSVAPKPSIKPWLIWGGIGIAAVGALWYLNTRGGRNGAEPTRDTALQTGLKF